MRVSVIMTLHSQKSLVESARSITTAMPQGVDTHRIELPNKVEINPLIPAIPIGSGGATLESMESLLPENSSRFAVLGSVEVGRKEDIAHKEGDIHFFADPNIETCVTCGNNPAVGHIGDVQNRLNVSKLHTKGLNGDHVAVAIFDTGINHSHLTAKLGFAPRLDMNNSWLFPGNTTKPGQRPIDHGTMCAYDALIAAPKATLLDFPTLKGRAPSSSLMGGYLSIALQGYASLLSFWSSANSPHGAGQYKALVVNNSWGMFHPSWDFPVGHPGRYMDNPFHPFNIIVATLARNNADILFAAGNCGADCPDNRCQQQVTDSITGANAHPDVLTLAGCDTHDQRVGYSSQGPGIQRMSHNKPDLTAYTHFLGSEAFGDGVPDSGTSTACPVAAGCVAAIRTKLDPAITPPRVLFDQLRLTARQAGGNPGWNPDYGYGIVDPVAAAQSLGIV